MAWITLGLVLGGGFLIGVVGYSLLGFLLEWVMDKVSGRK